MDDDLQTIPYCGACERPWTGEHFIEPPEGEYRQFVLIGRDEDCPVWKLGVTLDLARQTLQRYLDQEARSQLWDEYKGRHYPRRLLLDRLAG